MRSQPLTGERIVLAALALANTGELIRSSQERIDGAGYLDGLKGKDIPGGPLSGARSPVVPDDPGPARVSPGDEP